MPKPSFVYVTYIATTIDRLYRALTSAEFTERYMFGRRVESTWEVGAPVRYIGRDGALSDSGTVLEADPRRTRRCPRAHSRGGGDGAAGPAVLRLALRLRRRAAERGRPHRPIRPRAVRRRSETDRHSRRPARGFRCVQGDLGRLAKGA